MLKLNKQSIHIIVVTFLLICIAMFLRNVHRFICLSDNLEFIAGILRALIYVGIFSVWCFSIRQRIIHPQIRHFLTAIAVLIIFWISIRTIKFNTLEYVNLGRMLWYLYYLPMTLIPVLAIYVSMLLGKAENYRLPSCAYILVGISLILLIFVLTNDYHQLVFGFPNGFSHYENGEYTHLIVYYFIMVWISLCALIAFILMVVKCRIPYSKQKVIFPIIPLILLLIYSILYLTCHSVIQVIAGDMTVVLCILITLDFEICIQCGFIQSNTHYRDLFECTSINVQITDDDYNVLLTSSDNKAIPKETMIKTKNSSIMLNQGVRLCSAPIKNGHVLWSEDVSEMNKVLVRLAENSDYLNDRKTVLHRQVETSKEQRRLIEQNRLYNRLINDGKEEYDLFANLLEEIEATNDIEYEKKLIAKLSVVCTYIKRRSNLIFLSERKEEIDGSELQFAIEEWLSNLRLCNVQCNSFLKINNNLPFLSIIDFYDSFQWIINYTLDSLHTLLVSYDDINSYVLLNINCDINLNSVDYPNIEVDKEGNGEWVVKINVSKGGLLDESF